MDSEAKERFFNLLTSRERLTVGYYGGARMRSVRRRQFLAHVPEGMTAAAAGQRFDNAS
jgi:hypothetical protein